MFCCALTGLFLTQLAAFAGIVKIDRSDGRFLRVRESISSRGAMIILSMAVATIVVSGALALDISHQSGFVVSSRAHICSILGLTPPPPEN
jgi:hypothetical protein